MRCAGVVALAAVMAVTGVSGAQDNREDRHGRKYKAPPETSRIEVLVVKDFNGKPIQNAAVIFRPMEDGQPNGSYEVKTGPDGKATIDVIPRGATVVLQVLATGFASYAKQYEIAEANKAIEVRVIRPREQVSAYQDNGDKESQRKAGVQEANRPKDSKTNNTSDTNKTNNTSSPK
ncbi:carboxypeptidase regulatory-like domain-containing protein [Terriglobus albidus]|uniref:Carboxypeptidase regulatory-like domain-containing protein n=1 Tax=Terriglobus albidus TaxID=1592106 RepID=A0A5B9EF08_9BACT|nr:carboxypeptidase-like regulatory domain-containing protein [Terriglobus albidus]QEE29715.1 carboxypeptidase regulatory-like domain-containing protein [Terriglobus albidus]